MTGCAPASDSRPPVTAAHSHLPHLMGRHNRERRASLCFDGSGLKMSTLVSTQLE